MSLSDRERMMEYLRKHDLRWCKAFTILEGLVGVELRTPAIMPLGEYSDEIEKGDVSFLWNYGDSGFLVQLDIWFEEDDTPMVEWFWMKRSEDLVSKEYDGNEDAIKLADLPEKVIELLKEEVNNAN